MTDDEMKAEVGPLCGPGVWLTFREFCDLFVADDKVREEGFARIEAAGRSIDISMFFSRDDEPPVEMKLKGTLRPTAGEIKSYSFHPSVTKKDSPS
jgi:hypothetical protein